MREGGYERSLRDEQARIDILCLSLYISTCSLSASWIMNGYKGKLVWRGFYSVLECVYLYLNLCPYLFILIVAVPFKFDIYNQT